MTAGATTTAPDALPAIGTPRDAADVAALVREAGAGGTRLRIVGGGSWLGAGRPVRADAALPLAALRGVVDYVPGDLTLTAHAGTPLSEIARVTAAERQLLALDPFGEATGTLGATVATASVGPLAHAFGGPRDNVLGLAFVTGAGDAVRAGGRVVKNVAGFDLVRLLTGAWGTLGAITEVSVRLRAMPEVDATVAVTLPPVRELDAWLARLRATPLAAWALELVNAPLAAQLDAGDRALLLARLAGNAAAVAAQRDALAALGDVADLSPDVWARLRGCEPADAIVARHSARPSRLAALCAELFAPAARAFGLMAHASVSRGVVRFVLPGTDGFGMPRAPTLDATPVRRVLERAPAALWPTLAAQWRPSRADDALSRRVRAAFDPQHILNVGAMDAPDAGPAASA